MIRFLLVAIVGVALLFGCRTVLASTSTATYPFVGALAGMTLAKIFAEGGRRCHDLGRSGAVGLLLGIGILFLVAVAGFAAPGAGNGVATAIGAMLFALVGVLLFLLPGQRRENRYGAPPALLAATPGSINATRTLAFTAVAIVGTAAIGLLLATISDGMREQGERRAERAGQDFTASSEPAR